VKDCSLMQRPLAIYTLAAGAAVALAVAGGRMGHTAGVTLAVNVLIGVSFHVVLGPVLGERERKTLAFVMTLPVTPGDATLAKLLSSFVLFVIPATVSAAAFVVLSPVDVFAAMAASDRSAWSHVLGWVGYFGLMLGAWGLLFSIFLGAAIVSESIGWTIGVLIGLLFVVGNFALQVLPTLPGFATYMRSLTRGGPAFGMTLAVELAGIAVAVAVTLGLQARKTSFV
jgi:ABC-2 type transport system permease protein